ncbi:MAG: AarF/ABC1/UbiB kinase family protein [Deltaproteobacteria bacterium]|nr:AarF/ABC1/UbiB kinase family protein [Deltaproteobacteria bacterium]
MSDDHVKGGRLGRMARLAGVAARTGKDLVAARVKAKIDGGGDVHLAKALEPTAHRMVEVLGEMKGAATKFGQFLSMADQEAFPEEARRVLHRLLDQTPQRMDPERAAAVVRGELGDAPERVFAAWEPEPLASASMGQVHRARTHEGRDAVVKLQFPGVESAIESDIQNAAMMAKGLAIGGGIFDTREYVDEIAQTLRRELDYAEELRQLKAYREALSPWSESLVVPEPIDALCTPRLLTLERLEGPTLHRFAELPEGEGATPEARFRVAAQLVAAIWGPFLRQGLIHADPHPGNYIVLPDGRLGVLDFGATRQLSQGFCLAYWDIVGGAMRREETDFVGILSGIDFRFPKDRARASTWVDALAHIVERPIREPYYDWHRDVIGPDCRRHVQSDVTTAMGVRGPPESLMFYRAAVGAAGDFRLLRAAGDFRAVLAGVMQRAWGTMSPGWRDAAMAAGVPDRPWGQVEVA